MIVRTSLALIPVLLFACIFSPCQTQVEVQEVKELKRTGSLSTCGYRATDREKEFLQRLSAAETVTGSFMDKEEYRLRGKAKQYVSWFGVVRGLSLIKSDDHGRNLLIQQKYFDGLTDCHIMLVSNAGAGDFIATLTSGSDAMPLLSLVRVYGTIVSEENGVPQVSADYVRVWPWFTFTFTDMGPSDRSNPKWAKYCRICNGGRVYNPYPNEDYYKGMLGDPKDFVPTPGPSH
jgi:hypothetical protein